MPKRKETKDANQIAFAGLQELLRRDEERDKSKQKPNISKLKTPKLNPKTRTKNT